MRTTRIASVLGAMTLAAGTFVITAPAAHAAADPCVKSAKAAGVHKKAAREACGAASSGDIEKCATEIAARAKAPVKGDSDRATEICKSAAGASDAPADDNADGPDGPMKP
jgi:hypothetical protein